MNRLLLVLCGGDAGRAAASVLREAASRTAPEIVLLFVVDADIPASVSSWLIYVGFMGDKPSDDYRHTILKEYRRRAEEDLLEVQAKIETAGLPCRVRLEEGVLTATINRVAAEEGVGSVMLMLPAKSDVGAAIYHDAAKTLAKSGAFEFISLPS